MIPYIHDSHNWQSATLLDMVIIAKCTYSEAHYNSLMLLINTETVMAGDPVSGIVEVAILNTTAAHNHYSHSRSHSKTPILIIFLTKSEPYRHQKTTISLPSSVRTQPPNTTCCSLVLTSRSPTTVSISTNNIIHTTSNYINLCFSSSLGFFIFLDWKESIQI